MRPALSWLRRHSMNNGSMRAVGVIPRKREVAMIDHATPHIGKPTEVKVRTIEVGICGTDREICLQ